MLRLSPPTVLCWLDMGLSHAPLGILSPPPPPPPPPRRELAGAPPEGKLLQLADQEGREIEIDYGRMDREKE